MCLKERLIPRDQHGADDLHVYVDTNAVVHMGLSWVSIHDNGSSKMATTLFASHPCPPRSEPSVTSPPRSHHFQT